MQADMESSHSGRNKRALSMLVFSRAIDLKSLLGPNPSSGTGGARDGGRWLRCRMSVSAHGTSSCDSVRPMVRRKEKGAQPQVEVNPHTPSTR